MNSKGQKPEGNCLRTTLMQHMSLKNQVLTVGLSRFMPWVVSNKQSIMTKKSIKYLYVNLDL